MNPTLPLNIAPCNHYRMASPSRKIKTSYEKKFLAVVESLNFKNVSQNSDTNDCSSPQPLAQKTAESCTAVNFQFRKIDQTLLAFGLKYRRQAFIFIFTGVARGSGIRRKVMMLQYCLAKDLIDVNYWQKLAHHSIDNI